MPPQAQNTEKTIESFATGTQYKMTMRVFKPSGAYTTTTKYNCSRISMDKYEFTETGLCCIACPLNWCRMVLEPTCGQKSSVGL